MQQHSRWEALVSSKVHCTRWGGSTEVLQEGVGQQSQARKGSMNHGSDDDEFDIVCGEKRNNGFRSSVG